MSAARPPEGAQPPPLAEGRGAGRIADKPGGGYPISAALRAASAGLVFGALAAGSAAAQVTADYRNVTAGGPLRAGVYGRIVVKGEAAPPRVIYPRPVIANDSLVPAGVQPVYLYVPPGQVRKWKQNCAKWQACNQAVLFVRVEDSPSRWGQWRQRRLQLAQQERH